ncbi:MAG: CBS domain-containing protein [Geminicoccaceae bacterium]
MLEKRHRIKRVPVVADGHLVGIVSQADLVHAMAHGEAARLTRCRPASASSLARRRGATVDGHHWQQSIGEVDRFTDVHQDRQIVERMGDCAVTMPCSCAGRCCPAQTRGHG